VKSFLRYGKARLEYFKEDYMVTDGAKVIIKALKDRFGINLFTKGHYT
jgi:hypothetical protein